MIPLRITDYVSQGLALFTSQFSAEDAPQVRALTAAFLEECNALESAIWDVINLRQLANLVIYSPLAGTFTPGPPAEMAQLGTLGAMMGFPLGSSGAGTMIASVSQTGIIIPGLTFLTFADDPDTSYLVSAIDSTGTIITLAIPFSGPSGPTTATQQLTNSLMDTVGALVGQSRQGDNDLDYLSAIYLRIAVNRSYAVPPNWSNFAAIILRRSTGPAEYQEGRASLRLSVWGMSLNPIAVARVLTGAVTNGVLGSFGYSTWADGNDFSFTSRYDSTAGEAGFGSAYDSTVGGLLTAVSPLPPN